MRAVSGHPNVVAAVGITIDTEQPVAVMELVLGKCLKEALRTQTDTRMETKLKLVAEAADGLDFIHQKGYIHRDVAARNCLAKMTGDKIDQLKIGDFGMARYIGEKKEYKLTEVLYMPIAWSALETLEKLVWSVQSDIWSLGVLMWEIFAGGSSPYFQHADQNRDYMIKILNDQERLEIQPDVPPAVAAVMEKCWDANPKGRPSAVDTTAPAQFVPTAAKQLLSRAAGHGLVVSYRFTRSPSLFSSKMCSIELTITNESRKPIGNIRLGDKKLQSDMDMQGTVSFESLAPNQASAATIGIDFADTTQSFIFDLIANESKHALSISAPVGEQLQPIAITMEQFKTLQHKLSGMNETSGKMKLPDGLTFTDRKAICRKVIEEANVIEVPSSDDKLCFAGQTMSAKAPLLVCITKTHPEDVKLSVNCEKTVIGSMLFKQLKFRLSS